jgi:3'-phosphoadenosine 5'-phosphosulfate sulfotransferase
MTQKEQILDYLQRFKTITPMDAFADLGITKLATRVSEMRRDGVEFNIESVKSKNRFGKTVRFAKYSLKETNV